jgi:hypothetical protein
MWALGVSVLLLTGVAYEWRAARPLPLRELPALGTSGTGEEPRSRLPAEGLDEAVDVVFASLSETLRAAEGALRTGDNRAAPLLDGAMRVVHVLDYAGVSPVTRGLADQVMIARTRLQNGARLAAAAAAADAAARMAAVPAHAPAARTADLRRYRNAVVVDRWGSRVGRVDGVEGDRIRIEQSRFDHLLGFVRLNEGSIVTLPLERLVLGEPKRIGQILGLVLPPIRGVAGP